MPLTLISKPTPRPRRDSNYCYWLGKDRLYSPARVLRDLNLKPDYSEAKPHIVKNAANRGKLVEEYCYQLLTGKPVTIRDRHCGSQQKAVRERVEAFARWMEKYKPQYVDHQDIVWSQDDRIAWTRDLRVRINDVLWLVDIKCTAQVEKHWPLDLGCGLSYDEDGCDHAAILRLGPKLNKQGYQWRNDWSGRQLRNWWRIAVEKWKADYWFKRMKGELGFETEAVGFETEIGSEE